MLKKILVAIAVLLAVILAAAAMQPNEFTVTRETRMNAPVESVFAQVNDLHLMDVWSPWLKADANAKKTYEGPQAGTGASFAWEGNADVGAGKMTIVESVPNEKIRLKMEFLKPFESIAEGTFIFKSEGGQTVLTQSMRGENLFIGKIIHLFMNMDKMIGGQFENGHAALKAIVEGQAAPTSP